MAESGSKGGIFAKVIQKRVVRTKEKVLQNLGRADRTTDDVLEDHVNNFHKQQAAAARLQKELQTYIKCVKAMSLASKAFHEAIREVYEPDWVGNYELNHAIEELELMWEDHYLKKLIEEVQNPLGVYIARFPEVRSKVQKRGRKLVDYDSARHAVLSLEHAKKRDETKIARAQDELREAKKIYEDLNNELHEELPDLYESRVSFIASNFSTLFNTEVTFLEESAKLKSKLSDVASQLSQENSKGTYHVARSNSTRSRDHVKENSSTSEHKRGSAVNSMDKNLSTFYNVSLPNDYESDKHSEPEQRPVSRTSGASEDAQASVTSSIEAKGDSPTPQTNGNVSSSEDLATTTSAAPPVPSARVSTTATTVTTTEQTEEPKALIDEPQYEPISVGAQQLEDGDDLAGETCDTDVSADKSLDTSVYALASEGPEEELYRVPLSNEPIHKLPEGVLYQVQATHPYAGEDTDELTFDAGDIIDVVPFDDPDEQDEGWLMGMKKDGDKGVFPFNFTKRI